MGIYLLKLFLIKLLLILLWFVIIYIDWFIWIVIAEKKVVDLYVVGTSREDEINDYIYEQNYGTDKDYDDYDMGI